MLKLFLNNDKIPKELINIPKSQKEKYTLLLDFYKYILTLFPNIQTILNERYVFNINTHRKIITKKYNNELLKINPSLTLLNYFVTDDME